jgi:hypothetical protein
MKTKHTPGPWNNVIFCGDNKYKIEGIRVKSFDQEIENCYLIAAAPEMLEALEVLVDKISNGDEIDEIDLDSVRDLIDKARGES